MGLPTQTSLKMGPSVMADRVSLGKGSRWTEGSLPLSVGERKKTERGPEKEERR